MNKNVNPVLALVIITIFGSLLWLKFYFYGEALAVPKVQFIKKSSESSITIRLDNKLYDYSSDGQFKNIINLNDLGIIGSNGDFDFFSNGDLLINSNEYIPNLTKKLDAYARKENTNSAPPKEGKGLLRCNLSTLRCQIFNQTIPELQGAHYLHIDRETDTVYLADAARHEIRKMSTSGELLAELKTGLKFPNQVYLEHNKDGDKLWVVDTNHHVMKAVSAANENFGELIEEHTTIIEGERIWPSAFSKMEDSWIVNISNHAMENARVVRFDKDWKNRQEFSLPINADPVTSEVINGKLILADARNYTLYQYDINGFRLSDFTKNESTSGIQQALTKNKALDEKYQLWDLITLILGIGLFVLFFIYAVIKAKKDTQEEKEEAERVLPKTERDKILRLAKLPADGEWIEAKPLFKKIKLILFGTISLFLFSFAYFYYLLGDTLSIEIIVIFSFLIIIMPLALLPISEITQYKIGFFKKQVTIKTHTGRLISTPYNEIKWNDHFFMVNEWLIPIGNAKQSIFPYQKLQEKLMPYVFPANKVSGIKALKLQWKSPDGALKYGFLIVIIALLLGIYLERKPILEFLSNMAL